MGNPTPTNYLYLKAVRRQRSAPYRVEAASKRRCASRRVGWRRTARPKGRKSNAQSLPLIFRVRPVAHPLKPCKLPVRVPSGTDKAGGSKNRAIRSRPKARPVSASLRLRYRSATFPRAGGNPIQTRLTRLIMISFSCNRARERALPARLGKLVKIDDVHLKAWRAVPLGTRRLAGSTTNLSRPQEFHLDFAHRKTSEIPL